ncbi:Uncharacterised protein [Legionella pneumophila]|nr:hypothetical protein ULM_33270 [Legionella pneumophila]CZG84781.1 Uncharacterised protein [Legionella pneumophila]CZH05035.1 Uncharacterised protein [Legionella pneumophila]CZH08749.1 Uncharacterised protein [Legionella pneumophila]CZH10864.1 Uncharacterised protein [Legionella pneumophila]
MDSADPPNSPQTHRFKNLVVDHIGELYLMKLGELGK